MLVAQNSLGSVCPVPLTVRGTSRKPRSRSFERGAPKACACSKPRARAKTTCRTARDGRATSRALSVVSFYVYVVGGISLLSLVVQYLQERALPRSVTGAKDPTAPTQSEGGIDRFQLSNAPEVAVTLERHSLSPYRLTLTDGL